MAGLARPFVLHLSFRDGPKDQQCRVGKGARAPCPPFIDTFIVMVGTLRLPTLPIARLELA